MRAPQDVHVPLSYLLGASCLLPAENNRTEEGLTPAERRVLPLICAGCSNKEISSALGRAEATVKHQVSSILRKTRQPSRARLIAARTLSVHSA